MSVVGNSCLSFCVCVVAHRCPSLLPNFIPSTVVPLHHKGSAPHGGSASPPPLFSLLHNQHQDVSGECPPIFFKFLLIFSNLYVQCGTRNHNPEIKSPLLFRISQPGAPRRQIFIQLGPYHPEHSPASPSPGILLEKQNLRPHPRFAEPESSFQ